MDIGPYALPGLALLMLIYLLVVTVRWVFDGTQPETDIDVLEPPPPSPPQSVSHSRTARSRNGLRTP